MERKVNLKVAGATLPMVAGSDLEERAMRNAAECIDRQLSDLLAKYPGRPLDDRMLLVAVRESTARFMLQEMRNMARDEVKSLESRLDSYLKEI